MSLESINNIENVLNESPIRKYLKDTDGISIFENEKGILDDIDRIIKTNKNNLKNPLKIVILGEVKAGKSTLVNSIIGKKVSYTNVVEATASILEIRYSDKEKVLISKVNREKLELESLDELDKLIDENKNNQDFFSKINKILIEADIPRLTEITLVDTPGLNTVTVENEERTENYIVNADVVLWILNSHHLGQSDVSEKIEEVLDYGKPIICVLNRIDEIECDSCELIEYVRNEMGYMFKDIFATSAKKAWDGYCDKDLKKISESNINELYEYLINNIEKNANDVQIESILESIKVQSQKDINLHKGTALRIDTMLQSFNNDIDELKQFNFRIKDIINNKINEWIDTEFFQNEKELLINCQNDDEFAKLAKKYTGEEHLQMMVNLCYEKLQSYITDEWRNNTEEFIRRQALEDIDINTSINPYSIIATDGNGNNDIVDGIKQGGITAGAVGLGLAGYAAWLGPAAAYVTMGSAVAAFVPPLLIAGVVGGAVWKFIGSDKKKVNRYNQIEALSLDMKSFVRKNIAGKLKNNLNDISDYYFENSSKMIMSILNQCNISKDELVKINNEIGNYIDRVNNIK